MAVENRRKGRQRAGLICVVLLIVSFLVWRFGHRTYEEWDLSSGKQRIGEKVFAINVWRGQPRESLLSEWYGESTAAPDWIVVKRFPKEGIAFTSYSFSIHKHLSKLQFFVEDAESRHAYATLILEELRRSRSIDSASSRCSYADEVLNDEIVGDGNWRSSPESVKQLWARAEELLVEDYGPPK